MIGDLLEVSPGYADLRKCDDPNMFESLIESRKLQDYFSSQFWCGYALWSGSVEGYLQERVVVWMLDVGG